MLTRLYPISILFSQDTDPNPKWGEGEERSKGVPATRALISFVQLCWDPYFPRTKSDPKYPTPFCLLRNAKKFAKFLTHDRPL